MNISDEAVKAANKAVYRAFKGLIRPALVQVALQAAAPYLMAEALDALANEVRSDPSVPQRTYMSLYVRHRADDYRSAGAGE